MHIYTVEGVVIVFGLVDRHIHTILYRMRDRVANEYNVKKENTTKTIKTECRSI